MGNDEILCGILGVCLIMLLWCYTKPARVNNADVNYRIEGYGSHYQPIIEENTMLMRGPWDDVDYINPALIMDVSELYIHPSRLHSRRHHLPHHLPRRLAHLRRHLPR